MLSCWYLFSCLNQDASIRVRVCLRVCVCYVRHLCFMYSERLLVWNVGLRARAYCLKNEIHQEQTNQRERKSERHRESEREMIKLWPKERWNGKKRIPSINCWNRQMKLNITMTTKKKREKIEREKLMRTTIDTSDYWQCMWRSMYRSFVMMREIQQVFIYHSIWHTYSPNKSDILPLFTHFSNYTHILYMWRYCSDIYLHIHMNMFSLLDELIPFLTSIAHFWFLVEILFSFSSLAFHLSVYIFLIYIYLDYTKYKYW